MNRILLVLLFSCCCACSIGPDYRRHKFFSDEQLITELAISNNLKKIVPANWFNFLEDKELNKLIDIALKNSPNINIAREKLHQARYNLYMTNANLLPSLSANGEYVKSSQPEITETVLKQDYFQLGIDASWEIDIWGGQRRLSESAKAILNSVSADFNNIKTVLISEIAVNYLNWRSNQLLISETKKNIENQEIIFNNITSKYNAGLVDVLVYNQANSLLKSTKQKLPQLIIDEKKYLNSLAILTGILPSQIISSSSNVLNKKFVFDTKALYDLPINIVENRPDVISSEQQLIAQNALIGNKISNLLPSLSLRSLLGFQNNTLSPIFGKDFNMYSTNLESIMPIFHWGRIMNDIKSQESATIEALNNYKSTILQAIVDILNATVSVEEGVKNYELSKENLELYKNIAELNYEKYSQGLISFSDFLDAEKDRVNAQIKKHETLNSLLTNIIYFYKAIGGESSTSYSEQDDRKVCSKLGHVPCKG